MQYYHIRQNDANAMLEHWTRRQAAGKVPLRFKMAAKATRPNNPTPEESDADADMVPGEEAEEDLQEDGGSGAQGDGASQGGGGSDYSTERAHPVQSLGNAAENASGVGWLLKHGSSRR